MISYFNIEMILIYRNDNNVFTTIFKLRVVYCDYLTFSSDTLKLTLIHTVISQTFLPYCFTLGGQASTSPSGHHHFHSNLFHWLKILGLTWMTSSPSIHTQPNATDLQYWFCLWPWNNNGTVHTSTHSQVQVHNNGCGVICKSQAPLALYWIYQRDVSSPSSYDVLVAN